MATPRSLKILLLFFVSCLASATQSPVANYSGPKMRLAVMDLSGSALKAPASAGPASAGAPIAPPSDFARGMTDMLTTALMKTNRFIVLERAVMKEVVGEQDFGASGRVNAETAPKEGKIIGAQAMITGDITEFSYNQSSVGGNVPMLHGFGGGAKKEKVTALVAVDIRVIDAATGEVLASERAQGKAEMSNVSATVTAGGSNFNSATEENTPLGNAVRQALEGAVAAIVAGMQKARWSARVIDFRNGMLYVNAGSDMGMRPGMELAVFRPQEALVDPDTGQSIGTPDVKIGSVVVDSVQDKYCVAKVLFGTDMKRGDVVRFKGDAKQP
jgi:curli biogenesis system outer membrane secretion channel CsgG